MIIDAIYRPVIEAPWLTSMRDQIAEMYDDRIIIDEGPFAVHLIQKTELIRQRLRPDEALDVRRDLAVALSQRFTNDLAVDVRGATYLDPRNGSANWPVAIKIQDDEELIAENDAIFDILSSKGVRPLGRMFFSMVIGTMAMWQFNDGPSKIKARYALTDLSPNHLILGGGIIKP